MSDITIRQNRTWLPQVEKAAKKAAWVVCEQIKNDTWNLVPKDQGILRNTARIVFIDGGARLEWNQEYAEYQYTHPAKQYTTPGTTDHWVDKVRPNREPVWDKVFAKSLEKEGLK